MIHQHVKKIKRKHIREIVIYGMVGLTALFFQDVVYWILHRHFGVFPSVSMILGSFVGMAISYYGHVKFTFKKHRFSKREFTKFIVTSAIGICINVGGVRILTKVFMLSPEYGVIPTFITPLVTFLIRAFR